MIFVICSLRTNICLFLALVLLIVALGCFAGVHFELALENVVRAKRLEVVSNPFGRFSSDLGYSMLTFFVMFSGRRCICICIVHFYLVLITGRDA